jgi:RND family efflux transporter MFP subunit
MRPENPESQRPQAAPRLPRESALYYLLPLSLLLLGAGGQGAGGQIVGGQNAAGQSLGGQRANEGKIEAPAIRRTSQNQIAGFTEPDALITVATAEAGILEKIHVQENEQVEAGQILASLDDDLYRAQVAIAEQEAKAMGRVKAAQAERDLRQRRVGKLSTLEAQGKSHSEEVDRAKADLAVAEAQLESALDDQRLFELQLERAKLQLKKRSIFAPASGVIIDIQKQTGEYLSPTSPQLLQLARLDPLRAKFLVTRGQLSNFKLGSSVAISFPDSQQKSKGKVDRISPVSDAESGLTEIQVLIENPDNLLRGGDRCICDLPVK